MIQVIWSFVATLAVVVVGGIPFAALFRRRCDKDFWIYAIFYGLCAWIVILNFIFNVSGQFELPLYVLLFLFGGTSAFVLWRRRRILAPDRRVMLVATVGVVASLVAMAPAGLIGLDVYIGGFGGDSNHYARGVDFYRLYADHAPFHPFVGHGYVEPYLVDWRPGPSMIAAIIAETLGFEPFPAVTIAGGLSNCLSALAAYLLVRRFAPNGFVLWASVIAAALSSAALYNESFYFLGKALSVPVALATIVVLIEFAAAPLNWRRIGSLALCGTGLFLLMFESGLLVAPAGVALFVMSVFRRRWLAFLAGAGIVLILFAAATPNLIRIYMHGATEAAADSTNEGYAVKLPEFLLYPVSMLSAPLDQEDSTPGEALVESVAEALSQATQVSVSPSPNLDAGLRESYLVLAFMLVFVAAAGLVVSFRGLGRARQGVLLTGLVVPLVGLLAAVAFIGPKGQHNIIQLISLHTVCLISSGVATAGTHLKGWAPRQVAQALLAAWAIVASFGWIQTARRPFESDHIARYYALRPSMVDVVNYALERRDASTLVVVANDEASPFGPPSSPVTYMLNYYLRDLPTIFYRTGNHFWYATIDTNLLPRFEGQKKFCRMLLIGSPTMPSARQPVYTSGELAVFEVLLEDDGLHRLDVMSKLMVSKCPT